MLCAEIQFVAHHQSMHDVDITPLVKQREHEAECAYIGDLRVLFI